MKDILVPKEVVFSKDSDGLEDTPALLKGKNYSVRGHGGGQAWVEGEHGHNIYFGTDEKKCKKYGYTITWGVAEEGLEFSHRLALERADMRERLRQLSDFYPLNFIDPEVDLGNHLSLHDMVGKDGMLTESLSFNMDIPNGGVDVANVIGIRGDVLVFFKSAGIFSWVPLDVLPLEQLAYLITLVESTINHKLMENENNNPR
jgi:hypothetical protein